jgi:hypothetical protein
VVVLEVLSGELYGIVVVEDSAGLIRIQALVNPHQETRRPSRKPDAAQIESALRQMEKL